MNENDDMAKKITDTPVLVVQGSEDKLVKPSGTIELFNLINSRDKLFLMVGGKEHLIFEYDQCPEPVVKIILSWLKYEEDKD
jgi:alpha-beta hydrolase superfamily lysophospholipase